MAAKILAVFLLMLIPEIALAVSSSGCTERSPKRSAAAIRAFRKERPCPKTGKARGACPGFSIDHVVPLCCGGADAPSNMRWITVQAHRDRHAQGIVCETNHRAAETTTTPATTPIAPHR
jgi:hypothetical protein